MKTNLPVILLRELVLLPHNEIRLEFDNDDSKNIIDIAALFHDNHLLVVSYKDVLEETINKENLPSVGVVSKITHCLELPNGKIRVVIEGKYRAKIFDYLNINTNDTLESIIGDMEEISVEAEDEKMLIHKILHELETYVTMVPYMSNSILNHTKKIKNLDLLTDKIVPELSLPLKRTLEYVNTNDSKKRAMMLLKDIAIETENYRIEEEIDHKIKKEIDEEQREYILREKLHLIEEELKMYSSNDGAVDDLLSKINALEAPEYIKERLKKENRRLKTLPPMSGEVPIIENYIDKLISLPWNHKSEETHDLPLVAKRLNTSHYGLEKVKTRIIEYLAVKEKTGSLKGPILCLVGPPGVGKTSLARSIAEAMGRKFVKFSVGGVDDEAEIRGHRRTYLGAFPGRIITSLIKAQVSNPVLLIDEIDKIMKGHGDPSSALLEVLDSEQNMHFIDHYIEEEVDLSSVLFILTANNIEDIKEPLKDRLEIIELSSYTELEKVEVARHHLIPKQKQMHGITTEVSFTKPALLEMIQFYTKEAGVRELERLIAKILRKRVTTEVFTGKSSQAFVVEKEDVGAYLGKRLFESNGFDLTEDGVVNGLAYTRYGGDILRIEVTFYPGKGELLLTGSLGEVLRESCWIAYSYVKANYKVFGIDESLTTNQDVHIHVPEGAVPKDGPSAGVAITTALISALKKIKVPSNIAFTGEMTLRGKILPIGGLKEKSIGACKNHVDMILLPKENMKDLDEIPKEVKEKITYYPVSNYKEVYEGIFNKGKINKKGRTLVHE